MEEPFKSLGLTSVDARKLNHNMLEKRMAALQANKRNERRGKKGKKGRTAKGAKGAKETKSPHKKDVDVLYDDIMGWRTTPFGSIASRGFGADKNLRKCMTVFQTVSMEKRLIMLNIYPLMLAGHLESKYIKMIHVMLSSEVKERKKREAEREAAKVPMKEISEKLAEVVAITEKTSADEFVIRGYMGAIKSIVSKSLENIAEIRAEMDKDIPTDDYMMHMTREGRSVIERRDGMTDKVDGSEGGASETKEKDGEGEDDDEHMEFMEAVSRYIYQFTPYILANTMLKSLTSEDLYQITDSVATVAKYAADRDTTSCEDHNLMGKFAERAAVTVVDSIRYRIMDIAETLYNSVKDKETFNIRSVHKFTLDDDFPLKSNGIFYRELAAGIDNLIGNHDRKDVCDVYAQLHSLDMETNLFSVVVTMSSRSLVKVAVESVDVETAGLDVEM